MSDDIFTPEEFLEKLQDLALDHDQAYYDSLMEIWFKWEEHTFKDEWVKPMLEQITGIGLKEVE